MVFLRVPANQDSGPVIAGEGITLRTPSLADYSDWATVRAESRNFLTRWEPTWPADDLTRGAFRRRIRRYQAEIRDDHAYPFFLFRIEDGTLVGGLTLSNVTRGMTQSATIGYWMGEVYASRGYMTAALKAVIPFAFDTLGLHRLEAACLPGNAPSMRLLEKLDFQREGLARGLVCINGRWQDHIVFALLATDPRP
jgi:ribosomal-protein-alanine N-acetyltransferase